MANEFNALKIIMDELGTVIDAVPGVVYTVKSDTVDTLSIIEHSLEDSNLRTEIINYNRIFTKVSGVTTEDIVASAIAFIKIKTLTSVNNYNFTDLSIRELLKNYKTAIDKTKNVNKIAKGSKISITDQYEKEKIDRTIGKNLCLIEGYEKEIARIEKVIDMKAEEQFEVKEENEPEQPVEKKKEDSKAATSSFFDKAKSLVTKARDGREISEKLRETEKNNSQTYLKEIPYYDKTLNFDESFICKDISAYSLIRGSKVYYFGKTDHIKGNKYDNSDNSLYELTNINEDFIQFMTEDLLNDEYQLNPFEPGQKQALREYFNFVSYIFENNIGTTVTTKEYLDFKSYYNKLILTMFELEAKYKQDYYRALQLVDTYVAYLNSYDLDCSIPKNDMVSDIIHIRNTSSFTENLNLIIDNHIVDSAARESINDLINKITYFNDEKVFYDDKTPNRVNNEQSSVFVPVEQVNSCISGKMTAIPFEAPKSNDFVATEFNNMEAVTAEDVSDVKILIECLNDQRQVLDNAKYASINVERAVYDYLHKKAYIKKLGLLLNDKKPIYLFSSKNGSLTVPVLTDEIKTAKHLTGTTQGELVEFYEMKIKKIMTDFSQ